MTESDEEKIVKAVACALYKQEFKVSDAEASLAEIAPYWKDSARAALSALEGLGWGNLEEAYERAANEAESYLVEPDGAPDGSWTARDVQQQTLVLEIAAAIRALNASQSPGSEESTTQQP